MESILIPVTFYKNYISGTLIKPKVITSLYAETI